jgi:hypothetical protein
VDLAQQGIAGRRGSRRQLAGGGRAANVLREVAEMALAHTVKDRVEAAFRRGDLFEKRRALMEQWQSSPHGL